MVVDTAMEFLLPSWWEVQVTLAAAVFVLVAYWFFTLGGDGCGCGGGYDRAFGDGSGGGADMINDRDKMGQFKMDPQTNSAYLIKQVPLSGGAFSSKESYGANLNGTSDPYAIITCGSEKRFSSMVPGSRNPMWGEEFNFSVDELPVEEKEQSALRAHSSSIRGSRRQSKISEESAVKTEKYLPFIKEEVLSEIYHDVFPCTVEQFFKLLLDDGSTFINEYRSVRKDTNLVIGQWHAADEYEGQVREITFRSLCSSPMCPPDTAMTEWQHAVLSADKKTLVFETVQQAHDVPFGSYFEIHCRWSLESNSDSSCTLNIKVVVYVTYAGNAKLTRRKWRSPQLIIISDDQLENFP
ncbi:UNVERIFIED_CONTAM: BAG-associated GRAM protein 1 [Sesamum calycinum]|uniref:BAG-associated GRAM protein 1 n=1 Tax=Sesamum calycinum TaxID=2727403 RepID=A0AAW2RA12_9LAMI